MIHDTHTREITMHVVLRARERILSHWTTSYIYIYTFMLLIAGRIPWNHFSHFSHLVYFARCAETPTRRGAARVVWGRCHKKCIMVSWRHTHTNLCVWFFSYMGRDVCPTNVCLEFCGGVRVDAHMYTYIPFFRHPTNKTQRRHGCMVDITASVYIMPKEAAW